MPKTLFHIITVSFISAHLQIYAQTEEKGSDKKSLLERTELEIYGTLLYNNFNWDTDSAKRDQVDLNRVIFEPSFQINEKLKLEMEIEFEHGGTGSSMEFDRFEEFGEFEQEIEHGGEIIMEELAIEWEMKPRFVLIAGKIKVPVGLTNFYDKPTDYFTTTYNNMEATILPVGWYEIGVGAEGSFDKKEKFKYYLVFVNALDNSAFSSANWIQRGNQQRFEYVNAESFAIAGRLDFAFSDRSVIGLSGYACNSTPNRPKPDLDAAGWVSVFDAHTHVELKDLTFRVMVLYGRLQNADLISDANKNLSNNLNVKRTPVGSGTFGYFAEAGYDILSFFPQQDKSSLQIFAGYYYYDTMYETTGEIFNNPRWQRNEIRFGANYQWDETIGLKADFTNREINIPSANIENTTTIALTFNL
ncbi:MAG: autotransporter outer membrane beta-barrel domain-containing protein [Chitinophagales bacterium]|nr:autotransporter outer membrane beta-barrel domain-containing protein [Chitinophagales bacterium]